jgi:hypothetical protein
MIIRTREKKYKGLMYFFQNTCGALPVSQNFLFHFLKKKNVKYSFAETLNFQQIVTHLYTEGTVPVPRTAPSLCDCVVLPSQELSLQGMPSAAGAGALHAIALKQR